MKRKRAPHAKPEMPIAPMIDCVFLMLVYFMTTSSLERSETEQTLPVEQGGAHSDPLAAVDEQRLYLGNGFVEWNGARLVSPTAGFRWVQLITRLQQFKETCELAGTEPSLRLFPEPEATQQDLVQVLDAAQVAGITQLHLP
jgi:biopolymer transport protein ExbD